MKIKILNVLMFILLFSFMLTSCDATKSIKVTFETNGGSNIVEAKVDKDGKITRPTDPTKDGFIFMGWFSDEELENEFDFDAKIEKSITIYAKWLDAETTYLVHFEVNGGSEIDDVNVKHGLKVQKPADPTKEGFLFKGWYSDNELKNVFNFNQAITKDTIVYAKWFDENTTYTLSFNTLGGEEIASEVLGYDELPTEPATPKKDLHKFNGWFEDEECTQPYSFNEVLTENKIIYASFERVYVLGVSLNSKYSSYLQNIKEKENKKIEFIDRTVSFMVGNESAWRVKPIVDLATYDVVEEEFNEYEMEWLYDIKLIDPNSQEVLNNDDYLESFNAVNCSVKFKASVNNVSLKVVMTPRGLTERQQEEENLSLYELVYNVLVINGYNVYDALDLAYLESRPSGNLTQCGSLTLDYYSFWQTFKAEHNLDVNYHPSTLILQDNITITGNDIPSGMFYGDDILSPLDSDYERTKGSLIDYSDIYKINVLENETFSFYGNYFNIDCSSIREVQRERNAITPVGEVVSHATLFRPMGPGSFNMENMSISGNAPRVEDTIKAGGLIFMKIDEPTTFINNMLAYDFFITYMPNQTPNQVTIDSCKVYNAYNSFLYNWCSPLVLVKNCDFASSGGPVLIQDCINYGKENEAVGRIVFENCEFDSYVTGQENWFVSFNATALVGQVKAMDTIFNYFGKSFLKTDKDGNTYFNLIVVNKDGGTQGLTSADITGSTKIDNLTPFDFGETNPYFKEFLETIKSYGTTIPVFQGSNATALSGYGYFDGTGLKDNNHQNIVDPNNELFTSKYFGMYYNGMCFVFELFDYGQSYN